MRILSGKYKGRHFYMPSGTRPTQNVLRAAVFDILGHDFKGLTFLDLFSGSGAVGLEAISRGAEEVTMVEKDPKNAETIRENCRILGIDLGEQYRLLEADVFVSMKRLSQNGQSFDIVFFDPPFDRNLVKKTLKCLGLNDILHAHSFLVAQHDPAESVDVPEHMKVVSERRYGASQLTILQKVTD